MRWCCLYIVIRWSWSCDDDYRVLILKMLFQQDVSKIKKKNSNRKLTIFYMPHFMSQYPIKNYPAQTSRSPNPKNTRSKRDNLNFKSEQIKRTTESPQIRYRYYLKHLQAERSVWIIGLYMFSILCRLKNYPLDQTAHTADRYDHHLIRITLNKKKTIQNSSRSQQLSFFISSWWSMYGYVPINFDDNIFSVEHTNYNSHWDSARSMIVELKQCR